MMTTQLSELFPALPPLSILTVIAFCIVGAGLTLYLLSKIPELLLITAIAFIYGAVPLLAIVKHL